MSAARRAAGTPPGDAGLSLWRGAPGGGDTRAGGSPPRPRAEAPRRPLAAWRPPYDDLNAPRTPKYKARVALTTSHPTLGASGLPGRVGGQRVASAP